MERAYRYHACALFLHLNKLGGLLQESFREKLGSDWAVFPDHVEESPFFTSRGYLIANYMNTVHEEETEDEMEEVIK